MLGHFLATLNYGSTTKVLISSSVKSSSPSAPQRRWPTQTSSPSACISLTSILNGSGVPASRDLSPFTRSSYRRERPAGPKAPDQVPPTPLHSAIALNSSAPERGEKGTWAEFLKTHWEVKAATAFFTVELWSQAIYFSLQANGWEETCRR